MNSMMEEDSEGDMYDSATSVFCKTDTSSTDIGCVSKVVEGSDFDVAMSSELENIKQSPSFVNKSPVPDHTSARVSNPPKLNADNNLTVKREELNSLSQSCPTLVDLKSGPDHTCLVRYPTKRGEVPCPWPAHYVDKWDEDHVKLPCSPRSVYPILKDGNQKVLPRWKIVQDALNETMTCCKDIIDAIMKYNRSQPWNFDVLHDFFDNCLEEEEVAFFFEHTLPKMVKLALDLPNLVTQPIPLLKQCKSHSITLSQKMIGSLLANAFFCTYPRRNNIKKGAEFYFYPSINFSSLFSSVGRMHSSVKLEKLKCIFHYFRVIISNEPTGIVTYTRAHLMPSAMPNWELPTCLPKLHVSSGCIESDGRGLLQVDFANKLVGGGVLGWGSLQEEIRFLTSPEMILSRLFTECLTDTECLIITGAQQYSCYSGYSDSFKWVGPYHETALRDAWGRIYCEVVAIDAVHYDSYIKQYKPEFMLREINKAFVGFYSPVRQSNAAAIATGNWGCGAFGGHPYLKFLIQLLAAGAAHRDIAYYTFGDLKLKAAIENIYSALIANSFSVGDVWSSLLRYSCEVLRSKSSAVPDLFEFIVWDLLKLETSEELQLSVPDKQLQESKNEATSEYGSRVQTRSVKLKQSKISSYLR